MKTGIAELLLVLFIGLKLSNIINWSWVWVLSPIWITVSIAHIVFIISAYFDYSHYVKSISEHK